MNTTDFNDFLAAEHIGEDDYVDIEALFLAVQSCEDSGNYQVETLPTGYLVRGWSETHLVIASEQARQALISKLEEFADRAGFGPDIESWAGYWRAMDNPHA